MIAELIQVVTTLHAPFTEQVETRTYDCSCGAELVIEFPEDCNWDDRESGELDNAGWVLRGNRYLCGICRWKD